MDQIIFTSLIANLNQDMNRVFSFSVYIRYTFSSKRNIHKSSNGLYFWAPDRLNDEF